MMEWPLLSPRPFSTCVIWSVLLATAASPPPPPPPSPHPPFSLFLSPTAPGTKPVLVLITFPFSLHCRHHLLAIYRHRHDASSGDKKYFWHLSDLERKGVCSGEWMQRSLRKTATPEAGGIGGEFCFSLTALACLMLCDWNPAIAIRYHRILDLRAFHIK